MNRSAKYCLSVTVCVGIAASVPASAQSPLSPPPVIKIVREEVKEGHDASHEKSEAGYARALAKAGFANYIGMTAVAGPREAWFVEGYASYAAVEATRVLTGKEPAKSALEQLDMRDAESVSNGRTLFAAYQKELSFMPERGPGKLHFVAVGIVRVRLGHDANYARLRAMTNAAGSTGGRKGSQLVYRVSSGAPNGTYITLRAMESLTELDPDPSVGPLPEVMGEARFAEFQKLLGEVEISSETMIFAISPAMSYPRKEMVDADPSFWKTPAAKPATVEKKTP